MGKLAKDKHSNLLIKFIIKSFMTLAPGHNVIKLFTGVIYENS